MYFYILEDVIFYGSTSFTINNIKLVDVFPVDYTTYSYYSHTERNKIAEIMPQTVYHRAGDASDILA